MRVLVALDGSTASEAALGYLAPLKPLGAVRFKLLAIAETYAEAEGLRGADAYIEREVKLLTAYLDDTARSLEGRLALPIEREVGVGVPDAAIAKAAAAFEADLIVLTTHGRAGAGRWAIGSVADKVLQDSERAVLVIGPKAAAQQAPPQFRRILLPLDGSALAEQAVPVAVRWTQALRAELHVVRAVSLMPMTSDVTAGPELFEAMRESAAIYIARIKAENGLADASTAVRVGQTADELIAYCEENAIDLVIMTSHGRRGLLRSVLGSVTDRMLHGPAPVLVVRSQ